MRIERQTQRDLNERYGIGKKVWLCFLLLLAFLLFCLVNAGCATGPSPVEGGRGSVSLGLEPASSLRQGDNSATPSEQDLERVERRITTRPDGTVIEERGLVRSRTKLGTAQDVIGWAKQAASALGAEQREASMLALILAVTAWVKRKKWPLCAPVLAIGAVCTYLVGALWVAGTTVFVCILIWAARQFLRIHPPASQWARTLSVS